jgi:tRNA threonylcarbamoyladenosine biosynthesis protein TsaB
MIVSGLMNVLVLDTSTEHAVIGLKARAGALYRDVASAPRRHGRDLIPRLGAVLAEAGLSAREVDVIGVGLGPGSYTGLRVGVTAAKTLSYATGAALVGLDSLEAVARNAPLEISRVWVVADAQRGDVYTAELVREKAGSPLVKARECQIEALSTWLTRLVPGVLVLGPGLESPRIRAAVPPELITTDSALNHPDGYKLIELAEEAWKSGRRENSWLLEPRYLRRSAAEEQWDARNPAGSM